MSPFCQRGYHLVARLSEERGPITLRFRLSAFKSAALVEVFWEFEKDPGCSQGVVLGHVFSNLWVRKDVLFVFSSYV